MAGVAQCGEKNTWTISLHELAQAVNGRRQGRSSGTGMGNRQPCSALTARTEVQGTREYQDVLKHVAMISRKPLAGATTRRRAKRSTQPCYVPGRAPFDLLPA